MSFQKATLIKRYKRFLADVTMPDGQELTAHTANTGSMKGCWESGDTVALSKSDNPKRKYQFTLEGVCRGGTWIGVNTSKTNGIVKAAIENGEIKELPIPPSIRPEVKVGDSRLDLLLEYDADPIYVECKNVTYAEAGLALFPDSVSERGQKHLKELTRLRQAGTRAMMFYLIQRSDVQAFSPAYDIDPKYAAALEEAVAARVEVLAYTCDFSLEGVQVLNSVPLQLRQ